MGSVTASAWRRALVGGLVASLLALGAGCSAGDDDALVASATSSTTTPLPTAPEPSSGTAPPAPDTTVQPTTTAATALGAVPAASIRDFLTVLAIDDAPRPGTAYDRAQWPHWEDLDGDGCDARQEALRAASTTPAQVDPYGCRVLVGDWVSAYDGFTTSNPSELDIDHVVPLENAHESGGWAWAGQVRAAFANDPENLWAVSASSNRSKGSRTPDQWRPSNEGSWCEYASRWVDVKVRYALTATTAERDALGQMLERCTELPPVPVASGPAPAATPTPAPAPAPAPPTTAASAPAPAANAPGVGVSYENCTAARAAGAAPLFRGEPGYAPKLDRDGDGIACE